MDAKCIKELFLIFKRQKTNIKTAFNRGLIIHYHYWKYLFSLQGPTIAYKLRFILQNNSCFLLKDRHVFWGFFLKQYFQGVHQLSNLNSVSITWTFAFLHLDWCPFLFDGLNLFIYIYRTFKLYVLFSLFKLFFL